MIEEKIMELMELTDEFLYWEYYSHTNCAMYKIKNEWTKFKAEIWVLCPVSEGIVKALDLAIQKITECKNDSKK